MLRMLGTQEIENALEEMGELAIQCDFCGQAYAFDAPACADLFLNTPCADTPPSIH